MGVLLKNYLRNCNVLSTVDETQIIKYLIYSSMNPTVFR